MNVKTENRIVYTIVLELYLKPLLQRGQIDYSTYYSIGNLLFEQLGMQHFQNAYRPVKNRNVNKESSSLKIEYPEYVSLTELAKQYRPGPPNQVITGWMEKKSTKQFLSLWNQKTDTTIGIVTRRGANGGTYAAPAIAYYFMLCMSPEFAMQMIDQIMSNGVSAHE